jgi:hypothetical protein
VCCMSGRRLTNSSGSGSIPPGVIAVIAGLHAHADQAAAVRRGIQRCPDPEGPIWRMDSKDAYLAKNSVQPSGKGALTEIHETIRLLQLRASSIIFASCRSVNARHAAQRAVALRPLEHESISLWTFLTKVVKPYDTRRCSKPLKEVTGIH